MHETIRNSGDTILKSDANTTGITLITPGGSYPAFWGRDYIMSLGIRGEFGGHDTYIGLEGII